MVDTSHYASPQAHATKNDLHQCLVWKYIDLIMLLYPHAPDWEADDVLWYPARFVECIQHSAGTAGRFRFKWLDCVDWWTHEDPDTHLPLLIPKTYQRRKEICEEIAELVLLSSQVRREFLF
jgi:hypothetical protein